MVAYYSVREKQSRLVPDLQIDDPHYELKGIRIGSSHTNYRVGFAAPASPPASPRKEMGIAKAMEEKEGSAAGPRHLWRRRRPRPMAAAARGVGGIKPLAFGQFGEIRPIIRGARAEGGRRKQYFSNAVESLKMAGGGRGGLPRQWKPPGMQ
jgi:hypothetical protein